MADGVHNLGLELPVYEADREVILAGHAPVDTSKKSFLRHICMDNRSSEMGIKSLEDLLSRTDRVLEDVASHCGALVVPHVWGLKKAEYNISYNNLLPKGYHLVAEVDTIASAGPLQDNHLRMMVLYMSSRARSNGVDGYYWSDFGPRQFMFGSTTDQPTPDLYLVDIDPVIKNI